KDSSFVPFLADLKGSDPNIIRFEEPPIIPPKYYYSVNEQWTASGNREAVNFHLSQVNWRKLSYTALSGTHNFVPKNNTNVAKDEYDQFVFKQLIKGNKTGNLLHFIFENIDFANQRYWNRTIQNALKRFMPRPA